MSKQDTDLPRDAVAERAARVLDRCVIGPFLLGYRLNFCGWR
ncbi:hypothetical protein [Streptomyces mirabilis]